MTTLVVDGVTLGPPLGREPSVVDDVSFAVGAGEVLGVVGETAAGKSTLGLAVAGAVRDGITLRRGEIRLHETVILGPPRARAPVHRHAPRVGHVAQHAVSSLNPALRVEAMLASVLAGRRQDAPTGDPGERIRDALRSVSLPDDHEFLRRYPHQLSGGEAQRVAIALALVGDPEVVVLDEPTSGLDAVIVRHVLATIRSLSRERALAIVCISHDLAAIAEIADRIVVLYAGHVVEQGPVDAVLADPAHPYTRHLVAAVPRADGSGAVGLPGRAPHPAERGAGCRFANRCDLARAACRRDVPLSEVGPGRRARCVEPFAVPARLRAPAAARVRRTTGTGAALSLRGLTAAHRGPGLVREVVKGVSLEVEPGEWLAVVGESGAGKTTLIRAIAGLHRERAGLIALDGTPLAPAARDRSGSERAAVRLVSQDPKESFNPRRPIGHAVARPLRLSGADRAAARRGTEAALAQVALDAGVAGCLPGELSGGELQRASIARALVGTPRLLLGDEITSLLDSVVQAAIVDLLHEIHVGLGLTLVFVTHDLGLVQAVSDRTAVMADGRVVEIGPTAAVFDAPAHAATAALLASRRRLPESSTGSTSPGPGRSDR